MNEPDLDGLLKTIEAWMKENLPKNSLFALHLVSTEDGQQAEASYYLSNVKPIDLPEYFRGAAEDVTKTEAERG